MPEPDGYTKVTIRLRNEITDGLRDLLPYGTQDAVFRVFAEALLETLESEGPAFAQQMANGRTRVVFES